MGLYVQKYGGTSVADLDRIRHVAERVMKTFDEGNGVVVVLSAMAGVTDGLIETAQEITHEPDRRELDVLMATGEQVTASLLAMTLNAMDYPAQSLLGFQAKLVTDGAFGNARIIDIEAQRITDLIEKRTIVVIAGFQGTDPEGNITTLGRGGSDTSAVAIASAIGADACEIYTDVKGIYTADPNVCTMARKLDKISYDEMLEMASLGAKVLQIRSVAFAKKFNVPVHVRSSFSEGEGTMVVNEDESMESLVVSGITYDKNQARITLKRVSDQPGIASRIFTPIAGAGIQVDMIIQNMRSGGETDLTFTISKSHYDEAIRIAEQVAGEIGAKEVLGDKDIAKVSVTGVGMKNHSGVAAKMFSVLAAENINIHLISTSEIRISCGISEKYAELAVRVLHTAFGLDEK